MLRVGVKQMEFTLIICVSRMPSKSYAPSHSLIKTKTAKVHKERGKYKQNKDVLK